MNKIEVKKNKIEVKKNKNNNKKNIPNISSLDIYKCEYGVYLMHVLFKTRTEENFDYKFVYIKNNKIYVRIICTRTCKQCKQFNTRTYTCMFIYR
jgi:hypothetical protein